MNYFKWAFNTTIESLSQRAGQPASVFSTLLLSQMGEKGNIKQDSLPKANVKVGFPTKGQDIFLGGRAVSSQGHWLELLHPVILLALGDNGSTAGLNPKQDLTTDRVKCFPVFPMPGSLQLSGLHRGRPGPQARTSWHSPQQEPQAWHTHHQPSLPAKKRQFLFRPTFPRTSSFCVPSMDGCLPSSARSAPHTSTPHRQPLLAVRSPLLPSRTFPLSPPTPCSHPSVFPASHPACPASSTGSSPCLYSLLQSHNLGSIFCLHPFPSASSVGNAPLPSCRSAALQSRLCHSDTGTPDPTAPWGTLTSPRPSSFP